MPPSARISPARSAAFNVLLRVETRASYAVELLHSSLLAPLSPADRGLATELVMGVLRWQQKLDQRIEAAAGKSIAKFDLEVKLALRLGAYQLIYLNRIPPRAAVNESVELVKLEGKRSAVPLVNAVLRNLSREDLPVSEEQSAGDLARAYSHPSWLVERWTKNYGPEAARLICRHNQLRPRTTIRISSPEVIEELVREGIALKPASLVTHAWHLKSGEITNTASYRRRRLVVQDEASQLVALLAQGERILDCCAAPGGKTRIVTEQNPEAIVISVDLHLHRVRLMRDLTGSHTVLAADARQLPFRQQFDCVIADVPCSGTGTLARNPEIKWRLKPDDFPRLADLQLEILSSVARQAKRIVYSTCSLEPEEGEEVVARFLSTNCDFRIAPVGERLQELARQSVLRAEGIGSLLKGAFLRTIPGIHPCDGFLAALLERTPVPE